MIVPGAQPPSGRPRAQAPPPSATKHLPRYEEPTAPPTYPPTGPTGGYAAPSQPYSPPSPPYQPPNAPYSPPSPPYSPPPAPPRYPVTSQPRYSPPPPPARAPQRPLVAPPSPPRMPPQARIRRRPGFVVRAIRALVITALLIVVPVGAGIFAFATARDQPPGEVVQDIVSWIQGQTGSE
ncbi:hypothetical protein Pflav_084640 [Phytohabitans flavus]|uniref:Uncharacterized protein n=1 Tax=Phytohabitans flavus TaxID=1076124 RepID=A0A6F8Y7F5_9ACTN|nr:hypothetical protein [Phytohabitans flavus]BCB82054.1 hypothetical protein Pflav_084640 [Phytohabitans flavus]